MEMDNKFKIITFLLVGLIVFLQYRLWFEPGGILEMLHLKKELVVETNKNEKLQKRNGALLQQVQVLQKNKDAVEVRARHELGMVRKGETFYQIYSPGKEDGGLRRDKNASNPSYN